MATNDEFDMKLSFSVDKQSIATMMSEFDNVTKKVLTNTSKNMSGMGSNLTQTIQKMINKSSQMFKKAGKMLSNNLLNISPSDYKNFSTTIQKVFTNINKAMTTKDGGKQLKKELNNLTTLMNNFRNSVKDVRFDVPFKKSSKSTISEIHKLTKTFDNLFSQMKKSKQGNIRFPSLNSLRKELNLTENEAKKFQKELERIFRKGKGKNIGWTAQQLGLNETYKSISEFYQKYLRTTKNGENKIADFKKKEYKEQIRELRNFFDKQEKEIKEFNATSQRLNKQTKGFSTLGKQQIGQGQAPQQPPKNIFGRMVGKVKASGIVQGLTDIHHGFMMVEGAVRGVGRAVTAVKDSYKELDEGVRLASTLIDSQTLNAIGGLSKLKDITRDVSVLFGSDIPTVTSAMYKALTSGTPAENLQEVMTVANKLAVGGRASFDTVVDGMTSMINAFDSLNHETASLTRVSDAMFTAMKYGKFDLETLSHNLGQITTQAANMGMSMEESVSALAALTRTGLGAEQAATQIRSALKKLLDPSKGAQKIMDELGIAYGKNALEGGTFIEVITGMKTKLEEAGYGLQDVFEDVRGLQGIISLTSNTTEVYNDLMRDMTLNHQTLGATTQQAFNKMSDSVAVWENRAKAAFNSFLSGIGETFAPVFKSWSQQITKMFETSSQKAERLKEDFKNTKGVYETLLSLKGDRTVFFTEEDLNNQESMNNKLETLDRILPYIADKVRAVIEAADGQTEGVASLNNELEMLLENYGMITDLRKDAVFGTIIESAVEENKENFSKKIEQFENSMKQIVKLQHTLGKASEEEITKLKKVLEGKGDTYYSYGPDVFKYLYAISNTEEAEEGGGDFYAGPRNADNIAATAAHHLGYAFSEKGGPYKLLKDFLGAETHYDKFTGLPYGVTFENLTHESLSTLRAFLNKETKKEAEEMAKGSVDIAKESLKGSIEEFFRSIIDEMGDISQFDSLKELSQQMDRIYNEGLPELGLEQEQVTKYADEPYKKVLREKEQEFVLNELQKDFNLNLDEANNRLMGSVTNLNKAKEHMEEYVDLSYVSKNILTFMIEKEQLLNEIQGLSKEQLKSKSIYLDDIINKYDNLDTDKLEEFFLSEINLSDMKGTKEAEYIQNIIDNLGDSFLNLSRKVKGGGDVLLDALKSTLDFTNELLNASEETSSLFDTSFITKDFSSTSKQFASDASRQLEGFVTSTRDELASLSSEDMLPDNISDLMSKAVFDPAKLGDRLQETLSSIDVSTDNLDFSIDDILTGDVELPSYLSNIRSQLMGMKDTLMETGEEGGILNTLVGQLPDDLTARILNQVQELKDIGFIGDNIASDIESQFAAGKKAALQELQDLRDKGVISYYEMKVREKQIHDNFEESKKEITKRTYESMFNFAILKATELYSIEQQYINDIISLLGNEEEIRRRLYSILNDENMSLDNKRDIIMAGIDALRAELEGHRLITSELRTQAQVKAAISNLETTMLATDLNRQKSSIMSEMQFNPGDVTAASSDPEAVATLNALEEQLAALDKLSGTMDQVEKNTEDTKKTNDTIAGNTGKSVSITEKQEKEETREKIGKPEEKDKDKFFFSEDIDFGLGEKFLVDKKFNVQFKDLIDEMVKFQQQTEKILVEQLLQMNLMLKEAGYETISNLRKEYEKIEINMKEIEEQWEKQYQDMIDSNLKEAERLTNAITNEIKGELSRYINNFGQMASQTFKSISSTSDYAVRNAEMDMGMAIGDYIDANIADLQNILNTTTTVTKGDVMSSDDPKMEKHQDAINDIIEEYTDGVQDTVTKITEDVPVIPEDVEKEFHELMDNVLRSPENYLHTFSNEMDAIIANYDTTSNAPEKEKQKVIEFLNEITTKIGGYLNNYATQLDPINDMLISMSDINIDEDSLGIFKKGGTVEQLAGGEESAQSFATVTNKWNSVAKNILGKLSDSFVNEISMDDDFAENMMRDAKELKKALEDAGETVHVDINSFADVMRFFSQESNNIFEQLSDDYKVQANEMINDIFSKTIDPLFSIEESPLNVFKEVYRDKIDQKGKVIEDVDAALDFIEEDESINKDWEKILKGEIDINNILKDFSEGMELLTLEYLQYLREEALKEVVRVKFIKEKFESIEKMVPSISPDILSLDNKSPLRKFEQNLDSLNSLINKNIASLGLRVEDDLKYIRNISSLYIAFSNEIDKFGYTYLENKGFNPQQRMDEMRGYSHALFDWGYTYREVFTQLSGLATKTRNEFMDMYDDIIAEESNLLGDYEKKVEEAYKNYLVVQQDMEEMDSSFLDSEVRIDLDGDGLVETVTTVREAMERETTLAIINAQEEYQKAIIDLSRKFNSTFGDMMIQYLRETDPSNLLLNQLIEGKALDKIRDEFSELDAQLATLTKTISDKLYQNISESVTEGVYDGLENAGALPSLLSDLGITPQLIQDELERNSTYYSSNFQGENKFTLTGKPQFSRSMTPEAKDAAKRKLIIKEIADLLQGTTEEREKALRLMDTYNITLDEQTEEILNQLEQLDKYKDIREDLTKLEERALKDKTLALHLDTSILETKQQIAALQIEISKGEDELVSRTVASLELAEEKVNYLLDASKGMKFELSTGQMVDIYDIIEGNVTDLTGLSETQLEYVNKVLYALKEEKKLREDIVNAMMEEIHLQEEYWINKYSGNEILNTITKAFFAGERLDTARQLTSEEDREKAINQIVESDEYKDLYSKGRLGLLPKEELDRLKELQDKIAALREADLVDGKELAKLIAEFRDNLTSAINMFSDLAQMALDGIFSSFNKKGEFSINKFAEQMYDMTADLISNAGPVGAAVSAVMKIGKQVFNFIKKMWTSGGEILAEQYENQVKYQDMINERIQRQIELTELLIDMNHEIGDSLQEQINLYNNLLTSQFDFTSSQDAMDYIEEQTDIIDQLSEALLDFETSGAESKWGEGFGFDKTDDDWFDRWEDVLATIGITREDFESGKYTAEQIRRILEAALSNAKSNKENANEYLEILKIIAELEKERLETYSKFQQRFLELRGFSRGAIAEEISLTLELIERSDELRLKEEEVIDLMLKEAELRRSMVEYLEELLKREQELIYLRSELAQNDDYQTTYLELLGTQDLIIAKQYELQEAISEGLGEDMITELRKELLDLQLQEIDLQKQLFEGIQKEYEYRSRIVDLEGDIAIKRAKLAGYGGDFLKGLELDILDEKIAAKQAEYNRLEESITELQAEGIDTTEQDEELLGLENQLLDLQLERLNIQKEMNGELEQSNALYDEQLRAYLRSVIEARKIGDTEMEQEAKQNAAYRLLELGVTPEEIYRMLGVDVGIGDISGIIGDDYDYEEPDIGTDTDLEGDMPSIDDLIQSIDEWINSVGNLNEDDVFTPGQTESGWLYEVMTRQIAPALLNQSVETGLIPPGDNITDRDNDLLNALNNLNRSLQNNNDIINNNIGINIDNNNVSTKMSDSDRIRNNIKTERTLKG